MEQLEAKILLKNLLQRVEVLEDGTKRIAGRLTDDELTALNMALDMISGHTGSTPNSQPVTPISSVPTSPEIPPIPDFTAPHAEESIIDDTQKAVLSQESTLPKIDIDTSALSLSPAPKDARLCLDFGTAMSKATLVMEDEDNELEDIVVLELGVPGDQEEISEHMLISSVYISDDGLIWFGKKAEDYARLEGESGARQRMDNIKRWLSEGNLDTAVSKMHNPTNIAITYADVILAYITFLTWAVDKALENVDSPPGGYPRNLTRRFAMPCLPRAEAREVSRRLRQYIGEAQVLADSFFSTLRDGIPLEQFLSAVEDLRKTPHEYSFVAEDITEPLGVAGSLLGWHAKVDMLVMVVDVGAGTSDFSLYRINVNSETGTNTALDIEGSSRGVTEAGNHLDNLLKGVVLREIGVDHTHPLWTNILWEIEQNIRDYKETLFNEGSVVIVLRNGEYEVEISKDEFLAIDSVKKFGDTLRNTMQEILESVDKSWIDWVAV
ncbi:MAG: hypothetical protein R6X15_01250, partial [Pseudomonadota bacterium]